jgi:inner membrane protein
LGRSSQSDRISAMASLFTHAIAGATLGLAASPKMRAKPSFWLAILLCSTLPDIDVIGFSFGVHYGDLWGHRGMTHSLLFAAMLAACLAVRFRESSRERVRLALLFFVVTASHGVLDALTNGGLGVAFFSPFDPSRYFFPWRPLLVSPIGTGAFFSERGILVLHSEILWIWAPALALAVTILTLRARQERRAALDQDPQGM